MIQIICSIFEFFKSIVCFLIRALDFFRDIAIGVYNIIIQATDSTVASTIISGVLVFALTEVIKELIINPTHEYKTLRARIAYSLINYGNKYSNVLLLNQKNEQYDNLAIETRQLAAELASFAEKRYWFHWNIPKTNCLIESSSNLIGLSNSLYANTPELANRYVENNLNRMQSIKSFLKLKSVQ